MKKKGEEELSDREVRRRDNIEDFLTKGFVEDIGNYLLLSDKDNIRASNRPLGEKIVEYYNNEDDFEIIRPNRYFKETLFPFNHVRVGTGYPDLVGVRSTDRLRGQLIDDTGGTETALLAVEAKGYKTGDAVDVETGIVQAHDRLSGANAAYLAAPDDAITSSARGMARELNVGALGIKESGQVIALEKPRPVGVQNSDAADAIRFQATAQGVADQSFGLNHPKNYLGYAVSTHHPLPTEEVVEEYVVGAVRDARNGAEFLGLVGTSGAADSLTPLGREVLRFADYHNFEDSSDVQRILSSKRLELIVELLENGYDSISEVADAVHRDYKAVHTDLEVLSEYDVVRFDESGKGKKRKPYIPYENVRVELEVSEMLEA